MTRQRKRFDTNIKREAVRMVEEQAMSIAQVSQSMDIGETALRRWVKQYESQRNLLE